MGRGQRSELQRLFVRATDGWFHQTTYLLLCLAQETVQLSIIDACLEGFAALRWHSLIVFHVSVTPQCAAETRQHNEEGLQKNVTIQPREDQPKVKSAGLSNTGVGYVDVLQ